MADKKKDKAKEKKNPQEPQPEEYGAFEIEEREAKVDSFEVDDQDGGDKGVGAYNEKK